MQDRYRRGPDQTSNKRPLFTVSRSELLHGSATLELGTHDEQPRFVTLVRGIASHPEVEEIVLSRYDDPSLQMYHVGVEVKAGSTSYLDTHHDGLGRDFLSAIEELHRKLGHRVGGGIYPKDDAKTKQQMSDLVERAGGQVIGVIRIE